MGLLLVIGLSAQAATIDRLWTSLFTTVPTALTGSEVNGDGAGWWVEIWNATDGSPTAGNTTTSAGWFSPYGYDILGLQFTATESDSVLLRLYNGPTLAGLPYDGESGWYIDSSAEILPDLDDGTAPDPGDLNITFDFTGQTWQAVPEPATALLFGIGGLGAWMIRRNKRKAQEETDA